MPISWPNLHGSKDVRATETLFFCCCFFFFLQKIGFDCMFSLEDNFHVMSNLFAGGKKQQNNSKFCWYFYTVLILRGRVNTFVISQSIPFPMNRDGLDFHSLFQYMFYTWVQNCTRIESFFTKILNVNIECQTWLVMQRHAFDLKLSTVL